MLLARRPSLSRVKPKSSSPDGSLTIFAAEIVLESAVAGVQQAQLAQHIRERRSRQAQTKVPMLKGLTYEDAERKLHAANLNIRLLATRYDLPLQPGLIIDQTPAPGEEVVCGHNVGVTITKAGSYGYSP